MKIKNTIWHKLCAVCMVVFVAFAVSAATNYVESTAVELPGETMTNAPISCAPFPDRMSAYVWRNWFVVPHDRLARIVGASEADLEQVAAEMGLPKKVDVLPEWRRKGYITVLRRNWHLLNYAQLLPLLDMTRTELRFALMEDDFLWVKVGRLKPKCEPLVWSAAASERTAAARRRIAEIIREEGADDFTEEPRFAFVKEISATTPGVRGRQPVSDDDKSPFGLRLIASYFADYGDPLGDPAVGSFPEGLLQKLSAQGVNAVWLHTVLNTLAKDPKYPEFGEGSEKRMAHLRTLVKRAAKYGIKVYLYMNEPRAQPPTFFEANDERRAMKGVTQAGEDTFTMCTSHPETLRWLREALRSVFEAAPGLGGIFTITMSENHTNCASRRQKAGCPRCQARTTASIIAEVNCTLIEGMRAANPDAEAIVWNWAWPSTETQEVVASLPKQGCSVMAVSERGMKICRGGVPVTTGDYSISCVGPSDASREFWKAVRMQGLPIIAKVQANTTWEISAVPYLPVMNLVAEHASNLVKEGVDGVMLSWSLGCAPSPNLRVYDEIGADGDADRVLNRLAGELYGTEAVSAVRKAWKTFSEGFRNYPFAVNVAYVGPQHWGCANPLYWKPTGYRATMVGIPYDHIKGWSAPYPPAVWAELMQKVADGFEAGCKDWRTAIGVITDPEKQAAAKREMGIFRAATLHFASGVDQYRFIMARDSGNMSEMRAIADRECARAKEELNLVRSDSRIGYESSNHYFFIPQDLREKILSCRMPSEEPESAAK